MPPPDRPSSSDDADVTRPEERDRRLDFGRISEDQDPDTIAREVEAVSERHGL